MIKKYLPIIILILSVFGFSFSVYQKYIKTHEWVNSEKGTVALEMTLNESIELLNAMDEIAELQGITGEVIEKSKKGYTRIKLLNFVYFLLIIISILFFYWSLLKVKNSCKKSLPKNERL